MIPHTHRSFIGTRFEAALAAAVFFLQFLSLSARADIAAHPPYEPASPQGLNLGANIFHNATATASSASGGLGFGPEYAIDGRHDRSIEAWGADKTPAWLMVEPKEPANLNLIRLWTYCWAGENRCRYIIEGSLDGQTWATLVDHRDNDMPATETGETFHFSTTKVKYVRTTFTRGSAGGQITEIEGYSLPAGELKKLMAIDELWNSVLVGLHGMLGSVDERYPRDVPPKAADSRPPAARRAELVAWRGERVQTQFLLWTRSGARHVQLAIDPLRSVSGNVLARSCVQSRLVRYVLADGELVADILDDAQQLDLPVRSTRPVWVSIDVPKDAKPDRYTGVVKVKAEGQSLELPLAVEVLPARLPPPSAWKFRLDLWQNPYAVARYHHVRPWSEEHLRLLEPHLRMLAEAGQKCITASIVDRPWGTQTYDPYESMIDWRRRRDGTWSYDYRIFDRYVELCMRVGITDSINCYTVRSPQYFDEKSGQYTTGALSLEDVWRPFLTDFSTHLKEKGWLHKTALAMDEWPVEQMKPMLAFLRGAVPGLKIALAGSNEPELQDKIDDWCVNIQEPLDPAIARRRAAHGLPTTFYVCCGPDRPNTFVASPPAEAAWLGWYAAAQDYSGFLRWAYDSWVADPLNDTSYAAWPAGDCFMVYPGGRSSIRFERLREGIQEFEKVHIVRAELARSNDAAAKEAIKELDDAIRQFTYAKVQRESAANIVNRARHAVEAASRLIGRPERTAVQ